MSKKVFIPLPIDSTSTRTQSYFTRGSKGFKLILLILPSIIAIPFAASTTPGSIRGAVIGTILYLVVAFTLARFIILEEFKFKREFQDLLDNQLSDYKYFYGIDRVAQNGLIHYKFEGKHFIRKGVVIKITRGYRVGRGPSYKSSISEALRLADNYLLSKNIKFYRYHLPEVDELPEGIRYMYKNASKLADGPAKALTLDHINNIAYMAKKSQNLESIYMLLIFDLSSQFKHIDYIVSNVLKILNNANIFKSVVRLDSVGVEKFSASYLKLRGLKAFDFSKNIAKFTNYCTVTHVYDAHGNEEWFDESNVYDYILSLNKDPQADLDLELSEPESKKSKGALNLLKVSNDRREKLLANYEMNDEDI